MQSHPKAENPRDWEREKGCSRLEVKKNNDANRDANKGHDVSVRRKL